MEIERKWLLSSLPPLRLIEEGYAEQFYLSVNPEVRVRRYVALDRKIKEYFYLTIKGEGTLVRDELELIIPADFYEEVKFLTNKPPITKKIYTFELGQHHLIVSNVENRFLYGEIEFDSIDEATNFSFPLDDAVEVTDDPAYKMKNYWAKTRLA